MRSDPARPSSPTPALVRFIVGSRTAPMPAEILALARAHLLDTVASIVACAQLEPAVVARRYALAEGGARGPVTILPTGERSSITEGIFANAMTAHAAEINDFCPSAFVQPGPAIVSAVLGLAQARELSGVQVLRAMVCGYEVGCRFPKALGVRNLKLGGMATHGVGAAFGTAAACASLLGYDERQVRHTLAYAAQQASGSYNWVRDVAHVEKAFVFGGMPARQGVGAALMVGAGFTGVDEPFWEAPNFTLRSSFRGEGSDMDLAALTRGLGERFEVPLVAYKKYPVGGPTQPAVEAMLALVERDGRLDASRVQRVRVELPEMAATFGIARMPALSLPYLMALILEDGALDFEQAQSLARMASPSIQALMAKVEVAEDVEQKREPRVESARVTLTLEGGERREHFVEHVQGFPDFPMQAADVERKAVALMTPRLGKLGARRVAQLAWSIDELDDVEPLIAAITA